MSFGILILNLSREVNIIIQLIIILGKTVCNNEKKTKVNRGKCNDSG